MASNLRPNRTELTNLAERRRSHFAQLGQDDWTQITDPAERRKIQNRNASRVYRKYKDDSLHLPAKTFLGTKIKQLKETLRSMRDLSVSKAALAAPVPVSESHFLLPKNLSSLGLQHIQYISLQEPEETQTLRYCTPLADFPESDHLLCKPTMSPRSQITAYTIIPSSRESYIFETGSPFEAGYAAMNGYDTDSMRVVENANR
jgi:hypothetical protein